jgi:ParB-like chromosome segregation protein Spo0J
MEFPAYKTVSVESLVPYARNSRTHSPQQVDKIAASIREFGFLNPIITDGDNGIVAGHGRVLAAQKLGLAELPCIEAAHLTEAQRRAYVIADNRLALDAGWDNDLLRVELQDLDAAGFDLTLTGFELGEIEALNMEADAAVLPGEGENEGSTASLADKFGIPPFSVLNAREGWWQNRKRAWLALGIRSEVGRDIDPTNVSANLPEGHYMAGRGNNEGGSIFDPTLCELAYSWFCPQGGTILDPFAGGSVRGIVASRLGRQYIGVELRPEQVEANRTQGEQLCQDLPPVWHTGDSRNIDRICHDVQADFVFSCPPYADLEVYSDDPKDLSTLRYEDFKPAYFEIIAKACSRLKDDRFACFVVGDVRDKRGNYYNFVGDTVEAFRAAGLHFYNEAILVTSVGSLPIRAGKQFTASRKLGKTHQNVLVFVKGDGKRATQACGPVEVHIPDEENADLGEEL